MRLKPQLRLISNFTLRPSHFTALRCQARPTPTTGYPKGSRVEGVAPSTPWGRASRDNAGSWWVCPRREITPWGALGSPRATGADGAAPSMDERGLGEADSNGHPQGSRGAKPAASARPPPTTGYPKGSRVEGVAPSTPRGRASRDNAGSWWVCPRRGITPWGALGSPRATGADGAAPSRDERGLGEAAYNGHPQGSRGAKPAASARPPPTIARGAQSAAYNVRR
jgi:hypothetical protein